MSDPCDWSGVDHGASMPEPTMRQKLDLIALIGYGSAEWDGRELRLIREAWRHGWEAAQSSHDDWVEG